MEHSYEYGFILRYPADKVEVTGHEYSPTTFRYVGKEIATIIHKPNTELYKNKLVDSDICV